MSSALQQLLQCVSVRLQVVMLRVMTGRRVSSVVRMVRRYPGYWFGYFVALGVLEVLQKCRLNGVLSQALKML